MPQTLETCVCLCKQLGLPLHPEMLEGPATRLTILGIELDSETLQACLPAEKRDRIVTLLDEWSAKRFCRRRELESLIGHLHHACKVAPQGRTFLRRMINLLCEFRLEDHPSRLNQEFRWDLTWWRQLFQTWDGLCFFCIPTWLLSRTSRSHQMQPAPWAMVLFLNPIGFPVPGRLNKVRYL